MPDVIIKKIDNANKIKVIRIIRENTFLSLSEVTEILAPLDSGSFAVIKNLSDSRAESLTNSIKAFADIEIEQPQNGKTSKSFFSDGSVSKTYRLFDQEISFSPPAERYYDLIWQIGRTNEEVTQEFNAWYKSQGDIISVVNHYKGYVNSTLSIIASSKILALMQECEIYEYSGELLCKYCVSTNCSEAALTPFRSSRDAIIQRENQEKEYRAERKASRGRVVGGGFGLSNALTGMAEAGALNALSGIGHSMVNAVGNAGSSASANRDLSALYKDAATRSGLLNGLLSDVCDVYLAAKDIINEQKGNYIVSEFDPEKSKALFENAKSIPEKRIDLLTKAFKFTPYYADLLAYVFVTYPQERRTLLPIAERFHVDLSQYVEEIISREYTEEAQRDEDKAQKVRSRILSIMKDWGVSSSATLDRLEKDCLSRLCTGYENADEATCMKLKETVNSYEAQAENKVEFLNNIQKRIEEIWSAEDGEIFDNLLLNTDISNPQKVSESLEYIAQKGRTESSEKYVKALKACTPDNLKRAKLYTAKSSKTLKILAITFLLGGIALCIVNIVLGIIVIIASLFFFGKYNKRKNAWETITVDGTVVHPILSDKTFKSAEASSNNSQKGEKPANMTYCTKCGKLIEKDSKSCVHCGEKVI